MSDLTPIRIPCADGSDPNCEEFLTVMVSEAEAEEYKAGDIEAEDLDVESICVYCGSDQTYNSDGDNTTAID